jgi:NAD(P) transhydrogenase subunit alpha
MIVGVPGETASEETRVALTPPVAEKLIEMDLDVCVGSGAVEG